MADKIHNGTPAIVFGGLLWRRNLGCVRGGVGGQEADKGMVVGYGSLVKDHVAPETGGQPAREYIFRILFSRPS